MVGDFWNSSFEFNERTSLFADWRTSVLGILLYLATLKILLKWIEKRGRPFDLKNVVFAHNLLLSAGSAVLLWFLCVELLRLVEHDGGLFELWCDPRGRKTRGRLWFIYYVNYMFKWWELLDTFFLALRGKPTPFLHVYHHASILFLVWTQMAAQTCQQWIPAVINLSVHVVMYFYFALHTVGIHVWWKEWVTIAQLVQFVVVILSGIVGLTFRILGDILGFAWAPLCHGNWSGSFFGLAILVSYLFLFGNLYRERYPTNSKPHHRKHELLPAAGKQQAPRPNTAAVPKDFDAGKVSSWSRNKAE
jgi:fatty acid elongase 3